MAKNVNAFTRIPFVPYEEYATTFDQWQQDDDRSRWVGRGCTTEFPHNKGALEEVIDKEQGRKIIKGDAY